MESRTANAEKNVISSVIYQMLNLIVKFAMRTVFIYCLGKEYLGINGVFTNILSILNLSELGIGTAIIYDMYRPIAENDENKITQLVKFYKKVYCIIGLIILFAGLCLLPFLDVIIKDVTNVKNLSYIYILVLFQTVSSYFFAQYSSLIKGYQRHYIITRYNMFFSICKAIIECLFLILTKNYIVYLLIDIFLATLCNFCIYRKAVKLFPFIKKVVPALEKNETKKIFKNAIYNFSNKIGATVLGATDNLLLSMLVSVITVGVYSNYSMIIQIVLATSVMLREGITSGVGNMCALENKAKKFEVYNRISFAFNYIYALVACGLIVIIQNFIKLWAGEEYVLPFLTVIVVVVNCYLQGIMQPIEVYISADGLFKYFKYINWITAILNLSISIILGKLYGITGILLGTTISISLTLLWYNGWVVFPKSFGKAFRCFVFATMKHLIATFVACCVAFSLCYRFGLMECSIVNLVFCGVMASIVVTVIYILFFFRTEEYRYWISYISKRIRRV